ncbi:MAG: hypothetical protein AAFR58_25205 [Cyanobacteria bacterium J06627_28]
MSSYSPHSDVAKGFGLVMLLHVVVLTVLFVLIHFATLDNPGYLIATSVLPFFFVGFIRFSYVLPLLIYYQRRQQAEFAKGIAIAATLTFLANTGCFLVVFASIG